MVNIHRISFATCLEPFPKDIKLVVRPKWNILVAMLSPTPQENHHPPLLSENRIISLPKSPSSGLPKESHSEQWWLR